MSDVLLSTPGQWVKLGPWPVTVADGDIALMAFGNELNLSGIEVWSTGGTVPTPEPTPEPTSTPVPSGAFYRAIDLGGSAATIDGHAWEGQDATNYTSNGLPGSNVWIPLNPTTDTARADMIHTYVEHWAHEITLSNLPSGTYNVYLYAWQDWDDPNVEPFSVTLEGQTVESGITLTGVGSWRKLGPWTVEVTDDTLNLTTSGYIPKLSGLEIWRLP